MRNFYEIKQKLENRPLHQIKDDEFTLLIKDLAQVSKNDLGINGITLCDGEPVLTKLEIIIFIFALSVAVSKLPENDPKREIIQILQRETMSPIVRSLRKIDNPSVEEQKRWNNQKGGRSSHQLYLMIKNLRYFYIRQLSSFEDFNEHFYRMPLSSTLDLSFNASSQIASNRYTSGESYTEGRMISSLLRTRQFNSDTAEFRSIKKGLGEVIIDQETGLELDFPTAQWVDIEFDGPSHFIDQDCVEHNLDHIRKEQQLAERNIIRLSLSPRTIDYQRTLNGKSNIEEVSMLVANAFTLAPVKEFIQFQNKLFDLRNRIRKKIKIKHGEMTCDSLSDGSFKTHNSNQSKSKLKPQRSQIKFKDDGDLFSMEFVKPMVFSKEVQSSNQSERLLSDDLKLLLALEKRLSDAIDKNYLNAMINDVRYHQLEKEYSTALRLNQKEQDILHRRMKSIKSEAQVLEKRCDAQRKEIRILEDKLKSSKTQKDKQISRISIRRLNDFIKQQEGSISRKNASLDKCSEKLETLEKQLMVLDQDFDAVVANEFLHLAELNTLVENVENELENNIQQALAKNEDNESSCSASSSSHRGKKARVRAIRII